MSDRKGTNEPDRGKERDEATKADALASDDRHKTEKLTRHDGMDPNEGQE